MSIPYYYPVDVLRVIDGDTISVAIDLGFNITFKEYVRLWYVDTPEIVGKNATEEGLKAKLFTILWLQGNESSFDERLAVPVKDAITNVLDDELAWLPNLYVDSVKYNAREKYGRILGVFYRGVEEESLNQALLNKGLIKV